MNTTVLTTKNKVGLVIAGLMGLVDIVSLAFPTPDGEVGPPLPVLALGTVCGVVTVVAVILAWVKSNKGAIRIAAGARILSMLSSLPAFFVDGVPAGIKILAATFVILTMTALVLMLTPAKQSVPVLD